MYDNIFRSIKMAEQYPKYLLAKVSSTTVYFNFTIFGMYLGLDVRAFKTNE